MALTLPPFLPDSRPLPLPLPTPFIDLPPPSIHLVPSHQHVEKGNDDGLYISSVACCQELWALIMDAGTGFTAQVYSMSTQFLPKVCLCVCGGGLLILGLGQVLSESLCHCSF